jgi:hypothetical protein
MTSVTYYQLFDKNNTLLDICIMIIIQQTMKYITDIDLDINKLKF